MVHSGRLSSQMLLKTIIAHKFGYHPWVPGSDSSIHASIALKLIGVAVTPPTGDEDMTKRDAVKSTAAAQAAIRDHFDRLPIWRRERNLALHNLLAAQAVEAYKASVSPLETEILHAHRWF